MSNLSGCDFRPKSKSPACCTLTTNSWTVDKNSLTADKQTYEYNFYGGSGYSGISYENGRYVENQRIPDMNKSKNVEWYSQTKSKKANKYKVKY